jgi:nucleoid-associated protein YgaU
MGDIDGTGGLLGMLGKVLSGAETEDDAEGSLLDAGKKFLGGLFGGSQDADSDDATPADSAPAEKGDWDDDDSVDGDNDADTFGKRGPALVAKVPENDTNEDDTASGSSGEAGTVIVRFGDSLSAIAKRELGDGGRWEEIFDANRDTIDNPNLIYPGQVLNLPD